MPLQKEKKNKPTGVLAFQRDVSHTLVTENSFANEHFYRYSLIYHFWPSNENITEVNKLCANKCKIRIRVFILNPIIVEVAVPGHGINWSVLSIKFKQSFLKAETLILNFQISILLARQKDKRH